MPSLPSALTRRHLGWPVLLLLVGLVVTVVAVVQAERAAAAQERTTRRLLREYAEFAAWSYGLKLFEGLQVVGRTALGPILHPYDHEGVLWPDAAQLPVYYEEGLARCRCDPVFTPASGMAWTLGAAGERAVTTVGRLASADRLRLLRDTITAHARAGRHDAQRMGLVAAPVGDTLLVAAYGLMRLAETQDTVVYAVTYDAASLQRGFASASRGSILPRTITGGQPITDLFVFGVATASEHDLYESPGGDELRAVAAAEGAPHVATMDLPEAMGSVRVVVALRPQAPQLLAAGRPSPLRAVLLASLVVLAAALTAVAVRQLRRESELARTRADFVASVSHELRTPLAQMRLFLETLRLERYKSDEQRRWLLGHVERETTRLGHLVENVLAFARLGRRDALVAGEPALPTDVAREVAETVEGFAPLAALRDARLVLDARDHPTAPLHRAAFRQLLLNLLDNAVKYGPRGQTVTVRVERAGAAARVLVRDEGPGVPPAERGRIWEGFQRGALATELGVGGSGIGLALVREIARAHGGEAWLEGADGGATFVVEVPAVAATADVEDATASLQSPATIA